MDLQLNDARVLITAGASGIGLATARAFVREGARVHVCDVDKGALDALATSDATLTRSICDVADRVAITRLFDDALRTLGGLDVLVNNAGIAVGTTGRDRGACGISRVEGCRLHDRPAIVPRRRDERRAVAATKERG
jgi:NAD(P)-dependent dehydrogenase (short-subunit alcohol dehydrogenase family)